MEGRRKGMEWLQGEKRRKIREIKEETKKGRDKKERIISLLLQETKQLKGDERSHVTVRKRWKRKTEIRGKHRDDKK